jgi:hypothetical protein
MINCHSKDGATRGFLDRLLEVAHWIVFLYGLSIIATVTYEITVKELEHILNLDKSGFLIATAWLTPPIVNYIGKARWIWLPWQHRRVTP